MTGTLQIKTVLTTETKNPKRGVRRGPTDKVRTNGSTLGIKSQSDNDADA